MFQMWTTRTFWVGKSSHGIYGISINLFFVVEIVMVSQATHVHHAVEMITIVGARHLPDTVVVQGMNGR